MTGVWVGRQMRCVRRGSGAGCRGMRMVRRGRTVGSWAGCVRRRVRCGTSAVLRWQPISLQGGWWSGFVRVCRSGLVNGRPVGEGVWGAAAS